MLQTLQKVQRVKRCPASDWQGRRWQKIRTIPVATVHDRRDHTFMSSSLFHSPENNGNYIVTPTTTHPQPHTSSCCSLLGSATSSVSDTTFTLRLPRLAPLLDAFLFVPVFARAFAGFCVKQSRSHCSVSLHPHTLTSSSSSSPSLSSWLSGRGGFSFMSWGSSPFSWNTFTSSSAF